jgi:AcrR family transcriptional regulator
MEAEAQLETEPSGPDGERRRRRSDGERTHAAILDKATEIASIEGVTGLTLGRLAEALGVSKSGLYAHFGSKEQLQLETIEAAGRIIEREVIEPALQAPDGLARIEAACMAYISYVERKVFPGGCFFAGLYPEVDARGGPVREAAAAMARAWIGWIEEMTEEAKRRGEIRADVDAEQLAFELDGATEMANLHYMLFDDPLGPERGRRAVRAILARAAAGRQPDAALQADAE